MTAKEYLQQARTLDLLINAKQDELYALRLTATSVSSPMLGDKIRSGGTNSAMQIVDKKPREKRKRQRCTHEAV